MNKDLADAISLICSDGIKYFKYDAPLFPIETWSISNFSLQGIAINYKAVVRLANRKVKLIPAIKGEEHLAKVVLLPVPSKRKRYLPINYMKSLARIISSKFKKQVVLFNGIKI
ncbi:hypothetical protein [Marinobacterium aestuariivivens]